MATKLKDVMTANPVCCLPTDTVQQAAKLMAERHVGSAPVIADRQSQRLEGMITDRDITCSVVAEGKDPKTTRVSEVMTHKVVSCKADDDLAGCAQKMQTNQIRRIPVVDDHGRCIGVVAQADLALKMNEPAKLHQVVAAISKPSPHASLPRAAA